MSSVFKEVTMFWERFYALCEKEGIKPNPLGKKLGIASGTITQWKNGVKPSSDKLKQLAAYFNVTTDYLLGNEIKSDDTPATDRQLKFALFGTTDIDDELLEDVKKIAKIQLELKKKKGAK